jgi:PTH1 family peptidyl-tRNA hydrolase
MFIIVGLGNPGKEYEGSRHNIGFMVVDELADKLRVKGWRKGFSGLYSEASYGEEKLLFLKPQTYMNRSGESVSQALGFYRLPPERLIVIHDDIDLRFGQIKLKRGGGSAGHRGVDSVSSRLGTRDFIRLRIGVGRPEHGDVVSYVLSGFTMDERGALPSLLALSADAVLDVVSRGLESAMNTYNKKSIDVNELQAK